MNRNTNSNGAPTTAITGGARGIGFAIARAFAARGHRVMLGDLDAAGAAAAAQRITDEFGVEAAGLGADVRSRDAVQALADECLRRSGRLDVWINNAGVLADDLLLRMDQADWTEVMDVNLRGAFFGIQAAMRPMMKARRGRIVNLGSVSGYYGNAGQANYSAAKAGLMALTRSAARELAPRNVTVNCVAAGPIDNDFVRGVPEAAKRALLDQIPLKIERSPEDAVASAVRFLASEEADWITGAVLRVDGGLLIGH